MTEKDDYIHLLKRDVKGATRYFNELAKKAHMWDEYNNMQLINKNRSLVNNDYFKLIEEKAKKWDESQKPKTDGASASASASASVSVEDRSKNPNIWQVITDHETYEELEEKAKRWDSLLSVGGAEKSAVEEWKEKAEKYDEINQVGMHVLTTTEYNRLLEKAKKWDGIHDAIKLNDETIKKARKWDESQKGLI